MKTERGICCDTRSGKGEGYFMVSTNEYCRGWEVIPNYTKSI